MGKIWQRIKISGFTMLLVWFILFELFIVSGTILLPDKARIVDGVPNIAYYFMSVVTYVFFAWVYLCCAAMFYSVGDIFLPTMVGAGHAIPIVILADGVFDFKILPAPLFVFAGSAFLVALTARMARGLIK